MLRLLLALLILAGSVYADGSCNCPPQYIVVVNGVNYSSSFVRTTADAGTTWKIDGDIINDTFTFSLHATTHPDPDIDLDTSISGDPTVSIVIVQTFLGGPLLNLTTTSSGILEDLDYNENASVTPLAPASFIQKTTVVGGSGAVVQQNTGCDLLTPCTPSMTSQNLENSFYGVIIMEIGFMLSDGDKYSLHSNATLSPVPEPATMIPMVAGLLVMAGVAWRRKRNRLDPLR